MLFRLRHSAAQDSPGALYGGHLQEFSSASGESAASLEFSNGIVEPARDIEAEAGPSG